MQQDSWDPTAFDDVVGQDSCYGRFGVFVDNNIGGEYVKIYD